MTNIQYM